MDKIKPVTPSEEPEPGASIFPMTHLAISRWDTQAFVCEKEGRLSCFDPRSRVTT